MSSAHACGLVRAAGLLLPAFLSFVMPRRELYAEADRAFVMASGRPGPPGFRAYILS
jgi:hypothetical protein